MSAGDPNDIRLSVVIPTFNKASRIAVTLGQIAAYLAAKPYASEIVVVDDGSSDATADAARAALAGHVFSKVIRRERNRGKGASVREGILAASGRLILFCDDDLSTPIEELDKAVAALEAGADVVIGSRAHPDSEIRVRQRRPREWMGKAFNLIVRLFVLRGFRDTQCGFKAFRGAAAKDIFARLQTPGFGFDVEVLVLCRDLGYRVAEIPVVWCDVRPSQLRIFKGSWGMLNDLRRIRRQARRDARRR
ncbi:MAG TPA: dolichyl-phosphate beta-glucosyltransferase [Acidobacteriota bacterium]|nr:dolichyl-phosphate beta-glucosyltransferase [Acidobacteriota bacterium]